MALKLNFLRIFTQSDAAVCMNRFDLPVNQHLVPLRSNHSSHMLHMTRKMTRKT